MDWLKAFRSFNVPPTRYVLQYVVPLVGLGVLLSVLVARFVPGLPPLARFGLMVALPLFGAWCAFLTPTMLADRKRREIDNNIHFFVTHMGVLATANLPPVDILAKLGEKEEYGALAESSEEIAALVRSWNMGLPEACRFIADRTLSVIFADFLERFAYALETGEDLLVFLKNEQAVVMGDYATQYQANLYGVDSIKDMYMSTMMSIIFLVVFGLISPVLTGVDPGALTWLVAGMILVMEVIFLFLLMMRVPNDRLWTSAKQKVGLRRDLHLYLPATAALCCVAFLVAAKLFGATGPILLAISASPLAVLGYAATVHEAGIRRKDDNYPAFIRSLGASTTARGGSPKEVLRRLRRHDFGPLTHDVEALYRRLNLRLSDERAWVRFAHESSSNIIEKFTAMFTEGIAAGGEAAEIGRIVSDNVVRILALRKHRLQSAVGFRGMMIGLTAGMAGTLYIGIGLLKVLEGLFSGANLDSGAVSTGLAVSNFSVNVPLMSFVVTFLMLIHCIVGSAMVTMAGGGTPFRTTAFLPALLWITALSAKGADIALGTVG